MDSSGRHFLDDETDVSSEDENLVENEKEEREVDFEVEMELIFRG